MCLVLKSPDGWRMVRGAAARNKRLRSKKGARGEFPVFGRVLHVLFPQSGPRSANEMAVVRGGARLGPLCGHFSRRITRFGNLVGDLFLRQRRVDRDEVLRQADLNPGPRVLLLYRPGDRADAVAARHIEYVELIHGFSLSWLPSRA